MLPKLFTDKPKPPPGWVNSVIRFQYHDGQRIQEGLDKIFGANQYKLKCRNDRWVVSASRKLNIEERTKLDEVSHVHYSS
ncbi:hypothetical protein GGR54DRAFT_636237 [Hypoxylon sp. NC1633]|nr:hypothetical protein GGR54DRAFT_636237 [Hypoxylon sp. NC1633]